MLVIEYGENKSKCILRPVPLISISQNPIRNQTGLLGSYYTITLNGTLLPDEGSPYYVTGGGTGSTVLNPASSMKTDYNRPAHESVPAGSFMRSIMHKQNMIRELFKNDGQKFELLKAGVDALSFNGTENDELSDDEPILVFYPTVESINFEEGLYVNSCKYTVTLRAEILFDADGKIISDGLINSSHAPSGTNTSYPLSPNREQNRTTLIDQRNKYGGWISDYSETWSIEMDEGRGITNTQNINNYDPTTHIASTRTYRLTRSINATGRTIYESYDKRYEAWENAREYVLKTLLKDKDSDSSNNSTGYEHFPEYSIGPYFASGFLNIQKDIWGGYNHARTESIDITAGTFTLNDTWILSSGTAFEDYRLSLGKGSDNGLHSVSIEGTIKGLSSAHAGHTQYGGMMNVSQPNLSPQFTTPINSQYRNALYKFHQVTNSGMYGPNCYVFKRAQSAIHLPLNHIPLSTSLGTNEFTGEITYNVQYDTRPTNIVSGALSENITCSDTYPGDVFAVIPVLGRATGPILQHVGSRTEYQRSLSIELTMDRYYASGQGGVTGIRQIGVLSKPSLNEPFAGQLRNIIHAYSPIQETGIRKYFVNAPVETWDARTGRYTLQINWTYELDS